MKWKSRPCSSLEKSVVLSLGLFLRGRYEAMQIVQTLEAERIVFKSLPAQLVAV